MSIVHFLLSMAVQVAPIFFLAEALPYNDLLPAQAIVQESTDLAASNAIDLGVGTTPMNGELSQTDTLLPPTETCNDVSEMGIAVSQTNLLDQNIALECALAAAEQLEVIRSWSWLAMPSPDPEIAAYAAIRAQETLQQWSHTRPDGTLGKTGIPGTGEKGEILVSRYGPTAVEEVSGAPRELGIFMANRFTESESHYTQLLGDWSSYGIGISSGPADDGKSRVSICVCFRLD